MSNGDYKDSEDMVKTGEESPPRTFKRVSGLAYSTHNLSVSRPSFGGEEFRKKDIINLLENEKAVLKQKYEFSVQELSDVKKSFEEYRAMTDKMLQSFRNNNDLEKSKRESEEIQQ